MQHTIRQHYVQRCSLKQFSNNLPESGIHYIKVHKNDGSTFIENIKYVCCEHNFYEYESFNRNYIEKKICVIELKANNAFNKIMKEYNKIAVRNQRKIYNLNSFNCFIYDSRKIQIFKFIMLQHIRTRWYRDMINNDDLFFKQLNEIVNVNSSFIKNSCFYKNHNVYMCVNKTESDLIINDVNLYYIKDDSGNNAMVYVWSKELFFVFMRNNKKLNLEINDELINRINNSIKDNCYNYYFDTPTKNEIEEHRSNLKKIGS